MYAWLSPEGDFYRVDFHEHKNFAAIVIGCSEHELERNGWCALRGGYWDSLYRRQGNELTQAQYDTMGEWFKINDGRTNIVAFPAGSTFTVHTSYFRLFKVEGTENDADSIVH